MKYNNHYTSKYKKQVFDKINVLWLTYNSKQLDGLANTFKSDGGVLNLPSKYS
jgi:hypothetical protein